MDRAQMPQSGTAKEQPWLFRTYAGHSSAAASNALYRTNLARFAALGVDVQITELDITGSNQANAYAALVNACVSIARWVLDLSTIVTCQ